MNDEQLEIQEYIRNCKCPFCNDRRVFKSIAAHVVKAHGITAYEFREMAGLNRYTSICSPEYAEERRENIKSRPKEELERQLKAGRGSTALGDRKWRPQARENQLKDRARPERQEIFKTAMDKITPEMRSEIARSRSTEVVEAQTERILEAHKRLSPEQRRENSRKAGLAVSHETQVKAAAKAKEVVTDLHKNNPEWKENWYKMHLKAQDKRAKIKRSERDRVINRVLSGEKTADIAREYDVTARYIRRLVYGK